MSGYYGNPYNNYPNYPVSNPAMNMSAANAFNRVMSPPMSPVMNPAMNMTAANTFNTLLNRTNPNPYGYGGRPVPPPGVMAGMNNMMDRIDEWDVNYSGRNQWNPNYSGRY